MSCRFTVSGSSFRAVVAVTLGAALVLTGCGAGGDEEVAPSPSPEAEVTTQSPEPEPKLTETKEPEPAETQETELGLGDEVDPLEAFVIEERSYVDGLLASVEGLYKEITIEAEPPNGVVYTYTFAEQQDPDEATARLDEEVGWHGLNNQVRAAVFPVMEQRGIESPAVTYSYVNADGSGLLKYSFFSE